MRNIAVLLFLCLLLSVASASAEGYGYPFPDPIKATVYGTPPSEIYKDFKFVQVKARALRVKDRKVPDIFAYSRDMYYSTALHKEKAPLIFIIAGTGGEHDSTKMDYLTRVFYSAGFSVVALSSPTHMNFIISMSQHAVPGYVPYDVADLYRAMHWIKDELAGECEVSDYYVTGYSLGAMHAAYLAHMDDERHDFNFKKALLINPPVSLYHSVKKLDSWLGPENLGGRTIHQQIERFVEMFSDYYEQRDITDFDDNFLYDLVTHVDFDDTDLRALIGVDFRLSATAMIFSSDVCLRAGYLVPPDQYPLANGAPLMDYAEAAFDISFEEYMDEYLLPYLKYVDPTMDRYTMIKNCSLYPIRSWLMDSGKVVLIGNLDDVILNNDDVQFIEDVFGKRAHLFPTGGHCGNMMYGPFVKAMLEMIKS
ncbi:alpha/beta hydrolase [Pseudodesulfovibrio sp.]|uniref:alpha/beta hydrolase n=1 Tax=unclassified Pseudodesulfovibrio TaxID=2661612 RepID=UPI003B003FB6